MNHDRFRKARQLLVDNAINKIASSTEVDYFKVGEYEVRISSKGCSCTCEYGSMWGIGSKGGMGLPCSHIIACLCSYIMKKAENVNNLFNNQ